MANHPSPRTTANAAVGYLRRSTDRQEQSIPDQRKALERYAEEHGLRIVKFYTDDAISGTSTAGRRAFLQMIADAQGPARRFSCIVVYDVKRFGRVDNDEAGYYRHLLRQHGVEVRYVSENFNGDGTDDLLRPVKQWQAREESKDLSKVTIRGLLSRVDSGYWMGGVPPHGYDLRYENAEGRFLFILRHMPDGSKQVQDEQGRVTRALVRGESLSISKRDRAKLVLGKEDRVQVVKRIFRMYAGQSKGFKAIAGTFNREEVPTPRGPAWSHIYSGKWTDTTIRSILVNPVYTGDMVTSSRLKVQDEQGRVTRALVRGESLSISKRDRAKLVLGKEDRVQVVKRIFRMYAGQSKGFKAIAGTFNREEVPTPRGPAWSHIYSGKWTDTTIRSILVNPVYTGDMVWNRRTDGRFHKIVNRQATERKQVHGARLVGNPESDWIIIRDNHPALIPKRLFEQARTVRESRPASATQRGKISRPIGNWSGSRSRFILSGLLKCARCGNRYQGYSAVKGKRRVDGTVVRTFSYVCGGYITKGASVCRLNPVDQAKLESTVIEGLLEFYAPYLGKGGRKKLTAAVREASGAETQDVAATRKRIDTEQRKLSKTIENLLDNITECNRD